MEEQRTIQILNKCLEVFEGCSKTFKWINSFMKEHPHILEIPDELGKQITDTQLELFDLTILLENSLKSLGKKEENE